MQIHRDRKSSKDHQGWWEGEWGVIIKYEVSLQDDEKVLERIVVNVVKHCECT